MKKALLILVTFFVIVGQTSVVTAADAKMILATGGTAGTYYHFGDAMAEIWNSKIPGMNVTTQATGGSVENVRLVNRGEAELAIVQSDTIYFAFNAKEIFKEKLTKMAVLAVLYPEVIQVVVRGTARFTVSMISKGQGSASALRAAVQWLISASSPTVTASIWWMT